MANAAIYIALVAAMAAANPAFACRTASSQTGYFHPQSGAPAPGFVAAEVEIIAKPAPMVFEAKILRTIWGDAPKADTMLIRPSLVTSCDVLPRVRQRGIIIGRWTPSTDGSLTIDPVSAPAAPEVEPREISPSPP